MRQTIRIEGDMPVQSSESDTMNTAGSSDTVLLSRTSSELSLSDRDNNRRVRRRVDDNNDLITAEQWEIASNNRTPLNGTWQTAAKFATTPLGKKKATKLFITVNDPSREFYEHVYEMRHSFKYLSACLEVGTNNSRLHCHISLIVNPRQRISTIMRMFNIWQFGVKPEIETTYRFATQQSQRDYLTKSPLRYEHSTNGVQTSYFENGDWPVTRQGKRTDIDDFKKYIIENPTVSETTLFEMFPKEYLKYQKACQRLQTLYKLKNKIRLFEKRRAGVTVFWVFGGTGAGKTRWAWEKFGDSMYIKPGNSRWFDGYDGEDVILLDDFRKSYFGKGTFEYLLRLIDRYDFYAEVKGGHVPIVASTFVITAPWHPADGSMYGGQNDKVLQLVRRIYEKGACLHVQKNGDEVLNEVVPFDKWREYETEPRAYTARAVGFNLID